MSSLLLGIDIGTSATKAIVIDARGQVIATADAPHETLMPQPGWSEQDPECWWNATCTSVRTLLEENGIRANQIAAVGMSGQMHGSVFLPANASPEAPGVLRPALLWNDQRTAEQCREIEAAVGGQQPLVRATGNPALTGLTSPKILWLRANEPSTFERVAKVILPKDYIGFRLTGELVTDVGDASGTGLLDPRTRTWNDEILSALDLNRSILPECVESVTTIGAITAFASVATSLVEGTPVIAGSGDQMTGAAGSGIVQQSIVSATLGTSGVVFAHAGPNVPRDETGRLQIMCAAVAGEYCVYGCMLSAAGALHWFRDTLAAGVAFRDLDEEAARVGPGADGLVFLPYLTGERCPHPDPNARAAFVGLTARHQRAHLTRAVLEGVAMGMAGVLDLVRSLGVTPHEIRMSGGGARSELWRTIHAAMFGVPVTTLNSSEGSAFGAAMLAGVGVGLWDSVRDACSACISEESRIEPNAVLTKQYERSRSTFDALYPQIQGATL